MVNCGSCGAYLARPLCTRCITKELNDRNRKLEDENQELHARLQEKTEELHRMDEVLHGMNEELHDLQSRLAFLSLQPLSQPPDDIRKWDVAIVVQGKTDERLHAHRFILSSKSSVFSTMFDVKMSEEETGTIFMDDVTLPAIRAMIHFCYNADIDFTDEVTAEEVLKVAHKYQIVLLQSLCETHLIETLNHNNLTERWRLAKRLDARSLAEQATSYFKMHFDEVIDDLLAEL